MFMSQNRYLSSVVGIMKENVNIEVADSRLIDNEPSRELPYLYTSSKSKELDTVVEILPTLAVLIHYSVVKLYRCLMIQQNLFKLN